jgi:FMN-dependent NADH-azoreductase
MTTVLHINSSLFSDDGQSSQLSNAFVALWQQRHADIRVIKRDLSAQPLPHLDLERIAAYGTPVAERTLRQQALTEESDRLIAELQQADVLVLGVPMYNFGIPSTLKAYFDHIARAGITFRYTEQGAEGLLAHKKVYVFATRGGLYQGTALDSESAYLRDFLSFLGLSDIEFIYAEGLNINAEHKQQALAQAQHRLTQLVV